MKLVSELFRHHPQLYILRKHIQTNKQLRIRETFWYSALFFNLLAVLMEGMMSEWKGRKYVFQFLLRSPESNMKCIVLHWNYNLSVVQPNAKSYNSLTSYITYLSFGIGIGIKQICHGNALTTRKCYKDTPNNTIYGRCTWLCADVNDMLIS